VGEELRTEVRRLEDTVRREREGKKRLNDMLQGYKDEVSRRSNSHKRRRAQQQEEEEEESFL
jgi:hypothetical protein